MLFFNFIDSNFGIIPKFNKLKNINDPIEIQIVEINVATKGLKITLDIMTTGEGIGNNDMYIM